MKIIKYIISFCVLFIGILIIGESHTFRLNNFYTQFNNTTLYLQINTTEQEMVKDILDTAKLYNVEVFTFIKSNPTMLKSKIDIYGTTAVESYINKNLDISEKEYPSLFLEDIQFKFHEFETIHGLNKINEFYVIGSMEQVQQFKGSLVNKYAGNLPKEGYVDHDARNTIIAIWILMVSIILVLTYYDAIYQKRENLIRVSMGESISKLIWKNIILDACVFILSFVLIIIFLSPTTSVYFEFKISIFSFILLVISNSIVYINLYFYNLKEVFSNAKSGSRKLLSLNYGLKVITVVITVFVISSNIAVISESYQLYKQKPFFTTYSDYSYIRLEYRLTVNSDGSISNRFEENTSLQDKFYKTFFRKSNAVILSNTDDTNIGRKIMANRNAIKYLSSEIKELRSTSLDKEIYLLIPKEFTGNTEIIDSLQESVRYFEGESFSKNYEIIYYEDNIELIGIDVNSIYGSQLFKNPFVILNNVTADSIEIQPTVNDEKFLIFIEEIMYNITDEEFNQFVKDNGLTGELATKTNVLDKYNNSWFIAKRLLLINLFFSILVLILEFIIITSIIKLEYEVNAIELSIKKVLGHSIFEKNKKIILMTLITTILSIGASVATAILLKLDQIYYLSAGGVVILVLELFVMSFYIRRIENIKIQKILKGGNI